MKFWLTTLLASMLCLLSYSQTNISGNISSNTIWNMAGSPYILNSSVTITSGVTLIIDSGVTVQFNSNTLNVNGTLDATNTTFERVTGTGAFQIQASTGSVNLNACLVDDATNLYASGSGGFDLDNTVLNNTRIDVYGALTMDGGSITAPGENGINLYSGTAILNGVNISNAIHGIYAQGGSCEVNGSTIINCDYPVYVTSCEYLNAASVTQNAFTGNSNDVIYIGSSPCDFSIFSETSVPHYFPVGLSIPTTGDVYFNGGVIAKFGDYSTISVDGRLGVGGTTTTPVVFTSFRDDNQGGDSNNNGTGNSPNSGIWYGARFSSTADPSGVISGLDINYAGQSERGALDFDNVPVYNVQDCNFQQNEYGITARNGSSPTITNCTFGSSDVTPIAMTLDSDPQFDPMFPNTFSFADNQYDAIGVFGSTLTANNTLSQRNVTGINNVTYLMLDDITIPAGITMNIDAGIVLKSMNQHSLFVEGELNFNGTSVSPCVFTSVADDNEGNPNDTNRDGNVGQPTTSSNRPGGIAVAMGATFNADHTTFRYCNGYETNLFGTSISSIYYQTPWAVYDMGGTVSFDNVLFAETGHGYIGLENAAPTITNSNFTNLTSAPIAIQAPADPSLTNVNFSNVGLEALGIIGGDVSVDGAIEKRDLGGYTNITQVLLSDLTILNGSNLEIDAGVVLKVNNGRVIEVEGGFRTLGTSAEPVVITSYRDDSFGNPLDTDNDGGTSTPNETDWDGIRFLNSSDDSYNSIDHSILKYGSNTPWPGCPTTATYGTRIGGFGLLTFDNAGGAVANSTLEFGHFGISSKGNSSPVISNTSIDFCSYEPLAHTVDASPVYSNMSLGNSNNNTAIRLLDEQLVGNETLVAANVDGFGPIPYTWRRMEVQSNAVLTIEPGTVLKFDVGCGSSSSYIGAPGFYVDGALIVNGTPSNRIRFTSIKDDGTIGDTNNDGNASIPNNYDSYGFRFSSSSDGSINSLTNVDFLYSTGYNGSTSSSKGVLRFENSGGTIDNCAFEFANLSAIAIKGTADPVFTNNVINNITGAPVTLSLFSNPTFSGNSASNVDRMVLDLINEDITVSGTAPLRGFAGYSNMSYYLPSGDIRVNGGAHLTLPAGFVMKFNQSSGSGSISNALYYHFEVENGRLDILGTAANPVRFLPLSDDTYGSPADSEQNGNTNPQIYSSSSPSIAIVEYEQGADDASIIEHAMFRYAGVMATSAKPTIQNCSFNKAVYGIMSRGLEGPSMPNNSFVDLQETPIACSILSFPTDLHGNTVSGTTKRMIKIDNETLLQDVTLIKRDLGSITNIPYYWRDGFTVGTNAVLTMDPGLVNKFFSQGITVNRGLQALGGAGADNTIVFTHESDDFYGGDSNADGDGNVSTWNGLRINNSAIDALCNFDYCVVANVSASTSYGGINCINASPTISNSRFHEVGAGVRAEGASNPLISNCDFTEVDNWGVNNVNQNFNISALNCYWGDPTGPTHSGNPGGAGAPVTDMVDYMPFNPGPNAPIMGDVSLNGVVQAFDASLVLQHIVSSTTLSAQQLSVAETSGNGSVTSFDASLILQYVVGFINSFPAEQNVQGGTLESANQSVASLALANATVQVGDTFAIDATMSDVAALLGMDVTLNYDASVLDLLQVESLLPADFVLASNMATSGSVNISAAAATPLANDAPVFRLHFVANGMPGNTIQTGIDVLNVSVNETDVTTLATSGTVAIQPGLSTGMVSTDLATLSIYPNPSNAGIHVILPSNYVGQLVEVALFDPAGRMLKAMKSQSSGAVLMLTKKSLGLENRTGIYMLSIKIGEEQVWNRIVFN